MDTRERIILSAVGPDRVGLVRHLAGFVTEHGANIEDSNMAALGGEFAIILLAAGRPGTLSALEAGRAALSARTGLHVFVRAAATEQDRPRGAHLLTASCLDHPGVVHRLTSVLSEAGVNIESMETRTENAPESGAPIFRFEARLSVPGHVDLRHLRVQLNAIGQEKNIDVRLSDIGAGNP